MQSGTGRRTRSSEFSQLMWLRSGRHIINTDGMHGEIIRRLESMEFEIAELGDALDAANERADVAEALAVEFRQEVLDAVVNLNEALWPNGVDPSDDLIESELFEEIGANGTD